MGHPDALILHPARGTPGQTLCPERANCPRLRASRWPGGVRSQRGQSETLRRLLGTRGLCDRAHPRSPGRRFPVGTVKANSLSYQQNTKFRCLSLQKRKVETGTSLFEGRPRELIFFKIPFLPCFYLHSGLARMKDTGSLCHQQMSECLAKGEAGSSSGSRMKESQTRKREIP